MKTEKRSSIKRQIVVSFCLFAFVTSALFSVYNFVFAYTVEDAFFERVIRDEARYLVEARERSGDLAAPRQAFMKVYRQQAELPEVVRRRLAMSPEKREFTGEGQKHYHLYIAEDPKFYLLAEVSDLLVVRSRRPSILLILSVSTLLMLAFSGGVACWLAARATRPITELAKLVEHAAPEVLPLEFASAFPNNEIGVLAKSLEAAMRRVNSLVERERHFTRDVSHELRTPIAVIKGAAELLQADASKPSDVSRLVQRIASASFGIEQVVVTLLALAREAKPEPGSTAVRVLPLVERSVIQFAHLLDGKNVQVQVPLVADYCFLADKNVLQIIIDNLISNAFQHIQAGEVSVYAKGDVLIISDTGQGIEKNIQAAVCEPMVKGEGSAGFGLGLSLVKRLCEEYGFKFSIFSDNRGTRASIEKA
ncbi:MAG: HAMP domain-containing histidine kinase [Cellvibrionaceae bacterium]|nr:HAMP domain-containing histidine kinase [Cellvibrionaceae bacterium]